MLAPFGRDATIAVALLREAGIVAEACGGIADVILALDEGAGLVIATEEALKAVDPAPLSGWLKQQEDWSDLPFILLTRQGGGLERNPVARRHLDLLGNVTFIERPFHPTTLVSLARSALRGRRRQYQARARVEALRESEARFQALADNVSQLAWMAEPDGGVVWYNKRWYDYTGTTFEQMAGWGWRTVLPPDEADAVIEEAKANWARGMAWEGTYLLRSRRGEFRPFLVRAEPIRDETGRLVRWFGTNTDISAQVQSEAALRELNDTLEIRVAERTAERDAVWRLSRDLVAVVGLDGIFRAVNPAWKTVLDFGPEEVTGRSFLDFVWPDDAATTEAALLAASERDLTSFENRYRHRDGSPRWISWNSSAEGEFVYAFGRDVTQDKVRQAELEAAQDALRQVQKMETIGQLTGGIAHDFNNLLQIVKGNLEMLHRNLGDSPPRLRRAIDHALIGADRAAILTHRLLAFARRQPLAPRQVDVNALVEGMSELLHRTLGETIELKTALVEGPWRVEVDPNQLENALLNLAVNARDAMLGGGKLTIETSNVALADRIGGLPEVPPGEYVGIFVSDTGSGMEEAIVDKVFEPFFTTKEVGRGTGLGLPMVYGFVRQSGGHVTVGSEVGRGTTVRLYLPRSVADAPEDEPEETVEPPESLRGETVLVCEDDDKVRAYSADALRELGYRVLEAGDGREALRLLEREGEKVILLFSDLVLPGGMNGAELASEAVRRRPDLKILFTTGYARDAMVRRDRSTSMAEVIVKPFTFLALAEKVREVVEGRG